MLQLIFKVVTVVETLPQGALYQWFQIWIRLKEIIEKWLSLTVNLNKDQCVGTDISGLY